MSSGRLGIVGCLSVKKRSVVVPEQRFSAGESFGWRRSGTGSVGERKMRGRGGDGRGTWCVRVRRRFMQGEMRANRGDGIEARAAGRKQYAWADTVVELGE